MESVYNHGQIHLLKHEGMSFVVFNNLVNRTELDIIGCYRDKSGVVKRIRRGSVYGKMILKLYNIEEQFEISEQHKELEALISGIGKRF